MSCLHGEWREEDCAICVAENDTDEVDELRQAMRNLSSKYNELSVENERLRVCGNCFHSSSAICCEPLLLETDGDNYVETHGGRNSCHFKPSRWTGRGTQ